MAYRQNARGSASDNSLVRKDGKLDARWWLYSQEDEGDQENQLHARVLPLVQFLLDRQSLRRQFDLLHARLYGNLRFLGFGANSYTQTAGLEDERLTLNLCKNMIGAVVSRITKNRPRATILTSGEDWSKQRRARALEDFVDGQFYRTKFRQSAVDAFRDACIYGTGALKIFEEAGEICVENPPPWLLVVDETECLASPPRTIYERRYIDKEVAIDAWAKDDEDLAKKIRDARMSSRDTDGYGYDDTADQVLVTEAWHLGVGNESGRHCIVINNATLVDEPWEFPHLPFIFVRWSKAPTGFFGIGLVAELIGIQTEVQKLLRQIQQAHHLCAWPRTYVPRGAKVNKLQLNNAIGAIIEYDGPSPPQQASFPIIPQEVYNHLQFLIKSAYEIAGISQLTATSQKPAGIESGVALMTLQDVQSDRFTEVGRNWEQLFIDGAEQIISLCAHISKHNKDFAVQSVGKEELKEINWKEAELEISQYVLQVFPTSMLPTTPVGKLQVAELLGKLGVVSTEEMPDLLELPDTKAITKRRRAGRDVVEKDIANILNEGEFTSPEPFNDLAYGMRRAQEEYCLARLSKAPEEVLSNLRKYAEMCKNTIQPTVATPEQAQQAGPGGNFTPPPTPTDPATGAPAAQPNGAPQPTPPV